MDFIDDSDEEVLDTPDYSCETAKSKRASVLAKRPESCGVMQFHNGIEEAMLLHVQRSVTTVSAEKVLEAVDQYCYSRHWMMHIGDEKGAVLDKVVDDVQIDVSAVNFVEIGSYCGYSAVRMASRLKNSLSKVYCIEMESKCVQWTRRLAAIAGLSESIVVIEGEVPAGIDYLKQTLSSPIQLLLIDHDKSKYLGDLILFEESGLLQNPGGVVVADNVLSFGCPLVDYLRHVRGEDGSACGEGRDGSVVYASSELHKSSVEYASVGNDPLPAGHFLEDGVEVSVIGTPTQGVVEIERPIL